MDVCFCYRKCIAHIAIDSLHWVQPLWEVTKLISFNCLLFHIEKFSTNKKNSRKVWMLFNNFKRENAVNLHQCRCIHYKGNLQPLKEAWRALGAQQTCSPTEHSISFGLSFSQNHSFLSNSFIKTFSQLQKANYAFISDVVGFLCIFSMLSLKSYSLPHIHG